MSVSTHSDTSTSSPTRAPAVSNTFVGPLFPGVSPFVGPKYPLSAGLGRSLYGGRATQLEWAWTRHTHQPLEAAVRRSGSTLKSSPFRLSGLCKWRESGVALGAVHVFQSVAPGLTRPDIRVAYSIDAGKGQE
jgi:hypothetical protein